MTLAKAFHVIGAQNEACARVRACATLRQLARRWVALARFLNRELQS